MRSTRSTEDIQQQQRAMRPQLTVREGRARKMVTCLKSCEVSATRSTHVRLFSSVHLTQKIRAIRAPELKPRRADIMIRGDQNTLSRWMLITTIKLLQIRTAITMALAQVRFGRA